MGKIRAPMTQSRVKVKRFTLYPEQKKNKKRKKKHDRIATRDYSSHRNFPEIKKSLPGRDFFEGLKVS